MISTDEPVDIQLGGSLIVRSKILINFFFSAQFNYCRLICMLHSRSNDNVIRNLHERSLRLIYNDKNYEELLNKDNSISKSHRNIRALATEFFKTKNDLSRKIVSEISAHETESHHNIRQCNVFRITSFCTMCHGSTSVLVLGPKLQSILLDEIKQQTSLNSLKTNHQSLQIYFYITQLMLICSHQHINVINDAVWLILNRYMAGYFILLDYFLHSLFVDLDQRINFYLFDCQYSYIIVKWQKSRLN